MKTLSEKTKKELFELKTLYLYGEMEYFAECIDKFVNLKHLYLGFNDLELLPLCIFELNLETLSLRQNGLIHLPKYIGWLDNLKHLDLGGNQLNYIPRSISELSNLKYLHLWGNNINSKERLIIQELLPNTKIYY